MNLKERIVFVEQASSLLMDVGGAGETPALQNAASPLWSRLPACS